MPSSLPEPWLIERTPTSCAIRRPRTRPTAPVDLNVRSVALTLLAAAAVMWILNWAREVFIPIVLSMLISYALEPVVVWLMRMRLPRIAGVRRW